MTHVTPPTPLIILFAVLFRTELCFKYEIREENSYGPIYMITKTDSTEQEILFHQRFFFCGLKIIYIELKPKENKLNDFLHYKNVFFTAIVTVALIFLTMAGTVVSAGLVRIDYCLKMKRSNYFSFLWIDVLNWHH